MLEDVNFMIYLNFENMGKGIFLAVQCKTSSFNAWGADKNMALVSRRTRIVTVATDMPGA